MIVPAEKLPEASRLTIAEAVFAFVAASTAAVYFLPPIASIDASPEESTDSMYRTPDAPFAEASCAYAISPTSRSLVEGAAEPELLLI